MFACSNPSRRLFAFALVASLTAATVLLPGCSPTTDTRLVGKWTGRVSTGATMTYTFREDGNLDVKTSVADTPFPSEWSVLSWEGDDVTIRMLDYQQDAVVRKLKMKGADEFEMYDEADTPLGTFKRDTT